MAADAPSKPSTRRILKQTQDILLWGVFAIVCARTALNEAEIHGWATTSTVNRTGSPDVRIFDLPHLAPEPKHLDPVDPSTLRHKGYATLGDAQERGKVHAAAWIHVVDSAGRVLLLRHGPRHDTCPLSWFVLGEHAYRNEDPAETVRRFVTETLGADLWKVVKEHGRFRNMTEFPLYYYRDYGPSKQGRIDRQLTYLWLVEIGKPKFDISLDLDVDGTMIRWMPIDEFDLWVEYDMKGWTGKENCTEFCHETINSLLSVSIKRMYDMGITPPTGPDGRGIR